MHILISLLASITASATGISSCSSLCSCWGRTFCIKLTSRINPTSLTMSNVRLLRLQSSLKFNLCVPVASILTIVECTCAGCLVTDNSGMYVTLDFFVCCGVSAISLSSGIKSSSLSVIRKIGNSVNYKFILDTPFSVVHASVAATWLNLLLLLLFFFFKT